MDEEVAVGLESIRNHPAGSPVNDYIAGAIGGTAGLIVGHPLDTTKLQLQLQSKGRRSGGTFHALRTVNKQGLTNGLYRGASWLLMSYGVVNSIFFGVYGNTTKCLHRWSGHDGGPSYSHLFVAGSAAGAAQLVVSCPVERLKVILQSQIAHDLGRGEKAVSTSPSLYYKGPQEAVVAIVRQHGVAGCYRGLVAMAYRDIPSYGLYCLIYEYLNDVMHARGLTDGHGITASLVAGGMAGSITWLSIIPLDVVKNRMQADVSGRYKNMADCWTRTVREEGVSALYRGTMITCVRGFIVSAATFVAYSQTQKYLS